MDQQELKPIPYKLPDGKEIIIEREVQDCITPELFQYDLVTETIAESPLDYQKSLAQNIVLAGGSTCFQNFDLKLIQELQRNCLKDSFDFQITDTFNSESYEEIWHKRKLKNWTGASVSSTLSDFEWILRQDYFENGY